MGARERRRASLSVSAAHVHCARMAVEPINGALPDVALLDDSQRVAAATTLASAFFEDPGYQYIFPRESARRAGLAFMDRMRPVVMGGRPHWFLDHLGIDPRCQGTGNGTRLIRESIASLSAREALPCMLFTAKARNVPFYAQVGFSVAREDIVGRSGGGFRMWSMVREAAPLRGGLQA
jgi:ribosomal protein S18 acetylase RimI-like enzyme